MNKVCKICGGPYFAKGLCQKHYRQLPEVKAKQRAYSRAYYQRPEVKAKQRAYSRAYSQRPEVKAKKIAYYRRPRVPVIDCFEKDKPITLETLCERSGAGRGYVLKTLRNYQKLGLVVETEKNLFHLNPNSPYRMAVDGYFHYNEHKEQKTTETKRKARPPP